MATPLLRILNPQAPGDRQQAVVVPSKQARLYREKTKAFPSPPVELLSKATAMAKAEKLLQAEEGWVRLWENAGGIPSADISWLKEDTERGLFTPVQTYKDITGQIKRRRVMKSDRMWFYPPEPPGFVGGGLPTPQLFFRSRVFVWRPVGVWRYSLKCPRGDNCVGSGRNVHLSKSGYHSKVRLICDVSGWYTVITEVLSCGPCTKAARIKEGVSVGRWLAWDNAILSQLSEAHQAIFPAVLTTMRGVDRNVVRLLRDRTEGNTMEKVWRQVQENHVEDCTPGGIVSAMRQTFQAPPAQKQLPTAWLLRHAFLLAEANNVQDYRSQSLSTFGTVMKMDSTKKVVKKLSGQGRGSAEWFTSIGNEYSPIVSFVLTCEESAQKLQPMCRGVMERFRLANQPVPKILYIDRRCCRAQGPTSAETMFQEWFDGGMVVRLDIFHWIHRFDAAVRTDSHSKYAVFKSTLAGAVLAYNRTDLELLIKAVRAKDPDTFRSVSEQDVVRLYVTRDQLQHHVRRVTLGAQETFRLIHLDIKELMGPAGLDQSEVSLFKTPGAIDEMWVGQQRHLECIQDPPGMNMYRVARTTTINSVDLPHYKSLRGSNSLEGFHKSLPHMIPGPHCAARPYQVYLISGIARWNCDRSSDVVFGGKGRRHRTYSAPLIHRLNTRCQQLFGETVEENFRAPAEVDSNELLGLEYLFSESESGPFSLEDIIHDGPGPDEEVVQPGQPTPDPEADEAYQSDGVSLASRK
ncbi:Non-toxic nonhemagglutinin type D [Dissostichus eleginoides]|uniref:Non-toxic nonhemagglutinin type D n=1 Tax=Dissostichus eleginoides TaxID=100907 RepID=A0AAD9BV03_DISEL|nr:Non-toxic nonhemagglutinin type D [Dissostichus eleginoides]